VLAERLDAHVARVGHIRPVAVNPEVLIVHAKYRSDTIFIPQVEHADVEIVNAIATAPDAQVEVKTPLIADLGIYTQVRVYYPNVIKVYGAVVLREVAVYFRVFTGTVADADTGDDEVANAIAVFEHLEGGVFCDARVGIGAQNRCLIIALCPRLDALKAQARRNAQPVCDVENVFSEQGLVVARKIVVGSLQVVGVKKMKFRLLAIGRHSLPPIGEPAIIPRAKNECRRCVARPVVVHQPKLSAEVGEIVGEEIAGTSVVGPVYAAEIAQRIS